MKRLPALLAFIAGLLFGCFFLPFSYVSKLPLPDPLVAQMDKLHAIDSTRKADSVFYAKKADSLIHKVEGYKARLSGEKAELKNSQLKQVAYITALKSDSSISENGKLMLDSLHAQIAFSTEKSDSILSHYEMQSVLYKNLVAVRDTELLLCTKSFRDTKALLEEQFLREKKLTEDLNALLKEQRKKRNKSRLLAGGMLFISGVATTLLIKSRQ
jgi:hypothetical protein